MRTYEVIVIGAGHAGIEAGLISAKLGCRTLLLTMDIDNIGKLSCNPAVGGIGKSTLVKETDILGGAIARITDKALVSARILNRSKGEAVWSTRAQVDIRGYPEYAGILLYKSGVECLQAEATSFVVKNKAVIGVETNLGERFLGKKIIFCPGTFLKGTIHIGLNHFSGGRLAEKSADAIHDNLKKLGIAFKYFKTGTCARLDRATIDYTKMIEQLPEKGTDTFSVFSEPPGDIKNQLSCYITYTNEKTRRVILRNMRYSPLYTGIIKAIGVRYCPSLEDKIVKFRDKTRHQVFIEPEGFSSREVYPNGISTSLPLQVQEEFIHSIEGLENAGIIRPGYGIEHGVIDATQLFHTLETKKLRNFYCAGQINGTTGYEEAAAQGLVAGINACLSLKTKKPFIMGRMESLIGVLIDDLVTKGTNEPYRMFTARAEYRLTLRESNAFIRLAEKARTLGVVTKEEYAVLQAKNEQVRSFTEKFRKTAITALSVSPQKFPASLTVYEALKRPDFPEALLEKKDKGYAKLSETVRREVRIAPKYEGFIAREKKSIHALGKIARVRIPADIKLKEISGLSREVMEKLERGKPRTLQEALNISGVTPAAIMILYAYINRMRYNKVGNRK